MLRVLVARVLWACVFGSMALYGEEQDDVGGPDRQVLAVLPYLQCLADIDYNEAIERVRLGERRSFDGSDGKLISRPDLNRPHVVKSWRDALEELHWRSTGGNWYPGFFIDTGESWAFSGLVDNVWRDGRDESRLKKSRLFEWGWSVRKSDAQIRRWRLPDCVGPEQNREAIKWQSVSRLLSDLEDVEAESEQGHRPVGVVQALIDPAPPLGISREGLVSMALSGLRRSNGLSSRFTEPHPIGTMEEAVVHWKSLPGTPVTLRPVYGLETNEWFLLSIGDIEELKHQTPDGQFANGYGVRKSDGKIVSWKKQVPEVSELR